MSNTSEQNGRLSKTAEQAAPPTDPRLRNLPATAADEQRICRDFIWGICLMGEHCRYRHELEFEAMKSVLRFCHDYQNRTGCTRADCTYLHTSREEQNLFLTTGQIPRVLAERYAATALPVGSFTDRLLMPPPPPPPTNAHNPAPTQDTNKSMPQMATMTMATPMIGPMNAPMTTMTSQMMTSPIVSHMSPIMQMNGTINPQISGVMGPMHGPMPMTNGVLSPQMPAIIAPPPPPPPPPATSAPTRPTAPIYPAQASQTVQPPAPTVYPQAQAQSQAVKPNPVLPQLPPMFDPSRPPPPLPATAQVQTPKRPLQPEAFNEAGSSKLRKMEGDNDSFCKNCFRTQLRIDFYQQELEKQEREEKYNRALYAEKTEEYENGIRLLNTLFNSDMLQLLNDSDVNASSSAPVLNDYYSPPAPPSPSYNSEGSVSRNLLLQLVNAVANSYALTPRSTKELTPPLETRRPQPPQYGNNEVLAVLDVLKSLAESRSQSQAPDLNVLSRLVGEATAGSSRFPSLEPERSPRYPFGFTEERTSRYPVYEERRYLEENLAGPSRYQPGFADNPPVAPSVQPYVTVTYQNQVSQPPVRPYYAQSYQQPSTSANAPQAMYSSPGPSRSEDSPTSPQPSNGVYPQYMSRLPHQYYQPYQ